MHLEKPAGVSSVCHTDGPVPLHQALAGLVILAIFGIYACTTLLYVSPNNPLRIQFDAELLAFETWAYQKWSFFAPPPMHNDRLYFAFSPKNGDGTTVEVLAGIYARKQQDSPVNVRAQIIDYVISGTARQISDVIREIYRYREVNTLLDADPALLDELATTAMQPDDEDYGVYVRVLLRYAALVAMQQGLEPDGLKCQIALTNKPLRPFSQRFNSEFPIREKLIYRTAVMDVPRLVKR